MSLFNLRPNNRILFLIKIAIFMILIGKLCGHKERCLFRKIRGNIEKCRYADINGTVTVDCRGQNFDMVPASIPQNVTVLYLSNNCIKEINFKTFNHLSNLIFLDLRNNDNIKIENRSFANLKNLETLEISLNGIASKDTSPSTFEGLCNLKNLFLRENNRIADVPDIGNLTKLTLLDLSYCQIDQPFFFGPNYKFIQNLHTLILDVNYLDAIKNSNFENLHCESIETFSCFRCELGSIEKNVLQRFLSLRNLNLSGNRFKMPDLLNVAFGLSLSLNLSTLNLSYSYRINSISSDLFDPLVNFNLRQLILLKVIKSTSLKANTFTSLRRLLILDLGQSVLTFIEENAFKGLDYLQVLYLGKSTFVFPWMPSNYLFPLNLYELNLNEVEVNRVYSFSRLHLLTTLTLRKSSHFPLNASSFSITNSLQQLNLADSILVSLPNEPFVTLTSLTLLDLSNCEISLKHNIFHNLKSLVTLKLANCSVYQLTPGLFRDQLNLRELDLSRNFISEWPDLSFVPLPNLEYLFLQNNKIKVLSQTFFRKKKALTIDLNTNPFNCSCEMLWFRRLIEPGISDSQFNFLHKNKYICASPVEYAGGIFIDIGINEMEKKCQVFPWYIPTIVIVNLVALVLLIIIAVCYMYRWYVKWYCYKRFFIHSYSKSTQASSRPTDDICNKTIKIYFSCATNDSDWVEELITKFEIQFPLFTNSDQLVDSATMKENRDDQNFIDSPATTMPTTPSRKFNQEGAIYYEKRNAFPHLSQIGQMGEAIYNSKNVVLAISLSYLNNAKHQFEMDLVQQAMMERYGKFANSHVIFVAQEKSNTLISLLPHHLRHHFAITALVWNREDLVEQHQFWTEFIKRLD